MNKNLSFKGLWFLPENPKKEVSGTIEFSPQNGITLEIIGGLYEFFDTNELHDPDIILGQTTTGKKITLYKCFESAWLQNYPGIKTSTYTANFLFIGHHFCSSSDLRFNSLSVAVHNLSSWLQIYGFEKVESDYYLKSSEIKYKLPEELNFDIDDQKSIAFNFTFIAPFREKTDRIELEQKSELEIKSKNSNHFEDILNDYFHFQHFLEIGFYENTFPNSMLLKSDNLKREIGDKKTSLHIQVYFRPHINSVLIKKNNKNNFLFRYTDIKDEFGSVIINWYKNKDLLKPITSFLTDSFNKNTPFNENSFLNIIQAIETFHRRFRKNSILSKDEHKDKIDKILESVNPEYKQWLQERLNFSNEPTLHMRLEEIIDGSRNETLDKLISDKVQFIRDVKNSRNYYTHFDKRLENKALKGNQLFYLTEKLKVLLSVTVLQEIGIENIKVEFLLQKNEWRLFNHLIE